VHVVCVCVCVCVCDLMCVYIPVWAQTCEYAELVTVSAYYVVV